MTSALTRIKSVLGSHMVAYPLVYVLGVFGGYLVALIADLKPALGSIVGVLVGLVVAFGVPLWKNFFVDARKVSLEISSIKRNLVSGLKILLKDDNELSFLTRYVDNSSQLQIEETVRFIEVDKIDSLIDKVQTRSRELPQLIQDWKDIRSRVDAIAPSNLTSDNVEHFNQYLTKDLLFNRKIPSDTHKKLVDIFQKAIDDADNEFKEIQSKLAPSKRKIEEIIENLSKSRAFITVSCLVANTGNLNTAVRAPALLRVEIGHEQYIEIKMTLRDFENKSEIKSHGSCVLYFDSGEISQLPSDDKSLVIKYWGQAVRAFVLIQDIHGDIYKSNSISFSEGLYEKLIYDRLSRAASSED